MKTQSQRINALAINLYGRRIGIINRLAGERHLFSFEQDYIDDEHRPTLSLSFKGQSENVINAVRAYTVKLPPFFSNVLPEGHLRTYLAERVGVKSEREFYLLATLGADLPGALTAMPFENAEYSLNKPVDTQLYKGTRHHETPLRFSLAGVQLKFSAVMESSGGLTVPADGMGGSWIVKLPSTRFAAVPENEFVMLSLARAVGIDLPQNRLIDVQEIHGLPENIISMKSKAIAIKRFDRGDDGQRIHMEDFAQVFGLFPNNKYGSKSYANIATVLWAEVGDEAVYEFIRRLVFTVLIGNADMHLKNWSLLYPNKRTPILSPAYDFIATLPYIPNDQLALNFGDSRSLSEVSPDQIRRFADAARIPASPIGQIVVETIDRTITAWKTLDQKDLLPGEILKAINKQIQKVAVNTYRLL